MTDTTATAPAPAPTPAPAPAAGATTTSATGEAQTTFMTDLPTGDAAPAGSPEAIAAAAAAAATAAGEGEKKDGEGEQKTPEEIAAEEAAAKAAAGAPEKYEDFSAPDGVTLDATVVEQFAEVARELDLPQEKAQLIIDKLQPVIAKRQAEQLETMRADWKSQLAADKEFGGVNLEASGVHAARAMKEFATPEFRTLLNQSGLGDHPELVRFMVRAGRAISEEKVITSGVATNTGMRTPAEILYPSASGKK